MYKDMKNGNDKYMGGMKGQKSRLADGKHASEVMHVNTFAAQWDQNRGLKNDPRGSRGYPGLAWDYKY